MSVFKDKMDNKITHIEGIQKILNRIRNYWLDFVLMLLRWVGHIPFHAIRRTIYTSFGVKIGKGSTIHMWANFFEPKNIIIGEDTIIGDHVFLDGREKIVIGSHVDIASSVLIYNSEHDIHSKDFKAILGKVVINDYVFIGPRAIILPGVTLNKGAVIAAGAVVTKDVAKREIVGGVPAEVIGKRRQSKLNYKLGRARLFQ